jgi:hypothetical protein
MVDRDEGELPGTLREFILKTIVDSAGLHQGPTDVMVSDLPPTDNLFCVENVHFQRVPSWIGEREFNMLPVIYYAKQGFTEICNNPDLYLANRQTREAVKINMIYLKQPEPNCKLTVFRTKMSETALERLIRGK